MPIPLLHHYTSGAGLLGIFDSDSVWATLIHSLNDSKEFGHAIDQARSYLLSPEVTSTDFTAYLLSKRLAESLDQISRLNVYVACFSELEDSLSQWRGYCPSGFGYSLGMFGEELHRVAASQGFRLRQCIYDHSEQRRMVEQWALHALQDLRASLPEGEDPTKHAAENSYKYFAGFADFAPVLKHQGFKDEQEWRLIGTILSDDPRVKLRSGRSMLIPYVPIKLGLASNQSLVWNLRVGPTPNMALASNAATHFFRRAHIKNGISPSSVPYREW